MNWAIFTTLFIAIFASMLGQGLVVPLLPVYAREMGAAGLAIGFIFGAFSLSRTAFLPVFGALSDRKGRKPFLTIGLCAYALAALAFMGAQNVESLLLIRFLQGIAAAMVLPVAQAYAGELAPLRREGFIMGLMNVSLYMGLSAGPVIGGALKDAWGIQAAFGCMAALCLASCGLCALRLPPVGCEGPRGKPRRGSGLGTLARNRHLVGLFLFRTTHSLCIGAIWAFAPLLAVRDFGLSSSATGVIITLSVLISAVIMTPMGLLADRTSKRVLLATGGIFSIAAMCLLARARSPWELYAASACIGLGGGISVPAVMSMTLMLGRRQYSVGSSMSLITMGHSLGMIIGPLLAGALADLRDLRLAYAASALLMLLGTAAGLIMTAGFRDSPKRV